MLNASQNSAAISASSLVPNLGKNLPAQNVQGKNPQPGAAQVVNGGKDTKPGAEKGGVVESQDRFLKLLVTQMKNQDPLNPMDNAQVTSQMAQLSTVSGIDKLNKTLEALSNSMIASRSMQASSMIGHIVLAPGNKLELKSGKGAAAVELKQPADNLTVLIKDAAGNVVKSLDLGNQQAGVVPIQWDGKNDADTELNDGNYQFSAISKLGAAKSAADTLSYGLVNGVIQKPQGASLKVEQLGEISMDDVKQIL
jgi:flagellar basal-body rod modification protein FlgD